MMTLTGGMTTISAFAGLALPRRSKTFFLPQRFHLMSTITTSAFLSSLFLNRNEYFKQVCTLTILMKVTSGPKPSLLTFYWEERRIDSKIKALTEEADGEHELADGARIACLRCVSRTVHFLSSHSISQHGFFSRLLRNNDIKARHSTVFDKRCKWNFHCSKP